MGYIEVALIGAIAGAVMYFMRKRKEAAAGKKPSD